MLLMPKVRENNVSFAFQYKTDLTIRTTSQTFNSLILTSLSSFLW